MVEEHLPEGFLGAFTDDPEDLAITQRFCKLLAVEGLLAKAWPTEYGGGGSTVWEQTVVREEMWAHHEPRGPQYMGINWVGPAIMLAPRLQVSVTSSGTASSGNLSMPVDSECTQRTPRATTSPRFGVPHGSVSRTSPPTSSDTGPSAGTSTTRVPGTAPTIRLAAPLPR
jgi:hypothetical protein